MTYTTAFKRVLNVFVSNQCGLEVRPRNVSTSSRQDDDLYSRRLIAPKVQISTTSGEEPIISELDDDDEDAGPSSVTSPIVFSEDPVTCSNEMVEFANDLIDIAVTNIAESQGTIDASYIEDLSRWRRRLDRTGDMILETDTPTVRLQKARTYLIAAGELLKRVIIVVERAKSLNGVPADGHLNSTRFSSPLNGTPEHA